MTDFLVIVTKRDEPKAYVMKAESVNELFTQLEERGSLCYARTNVFAFRTAPDHSNFQLNGAYLRNLGELWDFSEPIQLCAQIKLRTQEMTDEAAERTLRGCIEELERELDTIETTQEEPPRPAEQGAAEDSGRAQQSDPAGTGSNTEEVPTTPDAPAQLADTTGN